MGGQPKGVAPARGEQNWHQQCSLPTLLFLKKSYNWWLLPSSPQIPLVCKFQKLLLSTVTVLINTYRDLLLRASVMRKKRGSKISRLPAKYIIYLLLSHSPGAERIHCTRFLNIVICTVEAKLWTLPKICWFPHPLLHASASFLNPGWNKSVTIKRVPPAVASQSPIPNTTCLVKLIKNQRVLFSLAPSLSVHILNPFHYPAFLFPRNYRRYLHPSVPPANFHRPCRPAPPRLLQRGPWTPDGCVCQDVAPWGGARHIWNSKESVTRKHWRHPEWLTAVLEADK